MFQIRQQHLVKTLLLGLLASYLSLPALADAKGDAFAAAIGKAHGKAALQQHEALQARLTVEFGGQTMIEGTLLTDTAGGKVRIDLDNGTHFVFDGEQAWTSPADSPVQGGRFHVLTWSYFLLAPFKLQDPGAHLQDLGQRPFRDGKSLPAAKLTFGSDVGDSPDDWYVVYGNDHHQLRAMAYIVTFGKGLSAAEKEPHAITYDQPTTLDGVTFFSHWQFWNWTAEQGVHGDRIGEVKLSDLRFVVPEAGTFTAPEDSRAEPLPGS